MKNIFNVIVATVLLTMFTIGLAVITGAFAFIAVGVFEFLR